MAQSDSIVLPSSILLYESLDSFHSQQTKARLLELKTQHKADWLRYLPTLGLAYTPDGQPRPTLSWSSTLLYTSQKQQQSKKAKALALQQQAILDLQSDRIRLRGLLRQWDYLQQDIQAQALQFQLDQQLFDIEQQKYDNQQLLPSEFLKIKRQFAQKKYALLIRQRELVELKNEILVLARFQE